MKTLILFFLFPLAGFSQEVQIATRINSVWFFSNQIKVQANAAIDSMGITGTKIDSVKYQNDTVLTLFGYNSTIGMFTDIMMVSVVGDTMYTAPQNEMYACSTVCKGYDCVAGCHKTAQCTCVCDGSCIESNTAYGEMKSGWSFGIVLRERIVISNGNEVIKD